MIAQARPKPGQNTFGAVEGQAFAAQFPLDGDGHGVEVFPFGNSGFQPAQQGFGFLYLGLGLADLYQASVAQFKGQEGCAIGCDAKPRRAACEPRPFFQIAGQFGHDIRQFAAQIGFQFKHGGSEKRIRPPANQRHAVFMLNRLNLSP
jgi:hypothetical protein